MEKNDLKIPDLLFNRELSWIEFNKRVLEEAEDKSNPLLERLKFLSIFDTNLDEFFMIRVSGLKRQIESEVDELTSDGMTAAEQREDIFNRVSPLVDKSYKIYTDEIVPELEENGIKFFRFEELSSKEKEKINKYFDEELFPVLTPIALDNVHPFPNLVNRTVALAIMLKDPEAETDYVIMSVIQVPGNFPRIYQLDDYDGYGYIFLEDIIKANAGKLFPGMEVTGAYPFRITRNADLEYEEEDADDLLTLIEEEVKKRRLGIIVRIEVDANVPERFLKLLIKDFNLDKTEIYKINGPLNLGDLMSLYKIEKRKLKFEGYTPRIASAFRDENIFKAIKKADILLHHPYYSFMSVNDFIEEAATDPKVYAIKITLYRISGNSSIIQNLINAAENNKQVTAVVELKARFDEENNIIWAKALEDKGVHVVYGVSGLKTHCKMALVVRREDSKMKRYLHVSSGNYNGTTARIYTDIGLFTANEDFCSDASLLFNYLTGYSKQKEYKKFITAPFGLRKKMIELIDGEIESHKAHKNGYIIMKMNALVDDKTIMKLYEASQEGVKIDLLVRGICRLKPGIKELSENIRVYSIVGRFLEHSRIYYFYNNGEPMIFFGSADIMQRNFDRRIEILCPVESPQIKKEIKEILQTYLKDNVKTRELTQEGTYVRNKVSGEDAFNAQEYFIERVKKKYQSEIKKNLKKKLLKTKTKVNMKGVKI